MPDNLENEQQNAPATVYLKDYTAPAFAIHSVELNFDLHETHTRVNTRLEMERHSQTEPLVLDGQALELRHIAVDGRPLGKQEYRQDDESLTLFNLPDCFVLEIETRIKPQDNTALEGLYKSSAMFCTQCEAEGFRKITYYLDRPDVMARFTTTIEADKARYPVLLSNGNLLEAVDLDNGRHRATWQDPFRKPSYLFALVAGDLVNIADQFITASVRSVDLHIYVEAHDADKCDHAMQSLKNAMKWDEEVFGLEYDLDIYMIVAVGDFNMGAMENKGLNIFNTKYVLASPETATDADYHGIEGVIGHEYFHNWSGNRVTCRDWFQLSLKEGLTVFRDQQFSADMTSRSVKRINDVRMLRVTQFVEDAGPMAHPVRPASYIEISNFYTVTIYEKGAEVIRMIHTLLGPLGFRKGIDLYFERHDGQAVTTDDFVKAMEDANAADLQQFKRWYTLAGTPQLTINTSYVREANTFTLSIKQHGLPDADSGKRLPMHIPMALGLLDKNGKDMPLRLEGEAEPWATTRVLELREEVEIFHFVGIPHDPVPSLFRGFSAPVKYPFHHTDEDLAFLLAHDSDEFNRWEAGQRLAVNIILRLIEDYRADTALVLDPLYIEAIANVIGDSDLDSALTAEILTLPSETYLGEQMDIIDVEAIHHVRHFVMQTLAQTLKPAFLALHEANCSSEPYSNDASSVAKRKLKNITLDYLIRLDTFTDNAHIVQLCCVQLEQADNMTDVIAALALLANNDCTERKQALATFYDKWQDEALVVDKWFAIQATSRLPDTLSAVKQLMEHSAFDIKNPNKVRALIGAFCRGNLIHFHDPSGSGYQLLGEQVLALNTLNPQIAARLLGALSNWRRFDEKRQSLMKAQLERVLKAPDLSKDVYEIALKSLA
ncbi:MAG: aminopeptidase N [Gammaproteobacteria bacterium]|nr:aminopeptidase N [Gammaproteobacteria bacterium]